jgi:hypothetical protein
MDLKFAIPMFVHGTVPPGVPVVKEMIGKSSYKFEAIFAMSSGGPIRD